MAVGENESGGAVRVDSHIRLTAHLYLVPGIRRHGLSGGWLTRPSVGMG
jgi:hypothetical protein